MVQFERFTLSNGLRVLVHEDPHTAYAVVNVLYNVGARDEDPDKTGFAHLFEHLMFGGSKHIPDYDQEVQMAGGENNAFTSNDITDYFIKLPAVNIETALWLESDRMLELNFSEKSLDVQRKVVSEEFKEHYLNKPYGDVWKIIRELAYQVHPYRWMTIGKELSHIEQARLEDVKAFFYRHYRPNQAILVVAGGIRYQEVKPLIEKWFGDIPPGEPYDRRLPQEPAQQEKRMLTVYRDVPADALYLAFPMCGRTEPAYYATELLAQMLGDGESSRLHQQLVKDKKYFSHIHAYVLGSADPGLLVIEGKLLPNVSVDLAENAVWAIIRDIQETRIPEQELQKAKNRLESLFAFEENSLMDRAINLAYFEWLGNAQWMNEEIHRFEMVTAEEVKQVAATVLQPHKANVLHYLSQSLHKTDVAASKRSHAVAGS
ncbi:M16 family metallopeptidase [Thermoflavifilum thermophilum]|nr:pitrilysin family protein [Thermoflavifilum thermophilum]